MEVLNLFTVKFKDVVESGIKSILLESNEENMENSSEKCWESQNKNNMSCSYCQIEFPDVSTQREHYKLDWHRFNLKQSLSGKNPVTEQEFDVKNRNDDVSSISGSDSEKEDTLDTYVTAQGRLFLQNGKEQIFSLYKCLIFKKKEELDDKQLLRRLQHQCIIFNQWTILMLGGGHFAGAIFVGDKLILHKTFHYYTVRAGQGGAQSTKDSKSGCSKSGGASLRRYNEQALTQHVQDLTKQWKAEIDKSDLIFYRANGTYNRSILFGGVTPIFEKSDERLRTIPFATRRATFKEVQRVHSLLSEVQMFDNLATAVKHLTSHKLLDRETKRNKIRSPHINRAKSRETVERPLPTKHSSETNSLADSQSESDEQDENLPLNTSDHEISFEHLQEFDGTEKPKGKAKKKKLRKSKTKKLLEQEMERKNEIIKILTEGNLLKLQELIENVGNDIEESDELKVKTALKINFVNEVLDDEGNSLMHIAALNKQCELVKFLLENESDPCLKNKKLLTPYCCTTSKDVRELMKDFAREYPDKYNYNKAQIPLSSLTPEELAERKINQKKIKREKEKIKKEENKMKRYELTEKERFLNLSDREKRALAAERRILSQDGKVTVRCFLCASDMSGKVPFEYLGNRFCTMDCLKAHRLKNPVTLS